MSHPIPEKAKLLQKLKQGGFDIPDFIYVPPQHFETKDFAALESFLERHRQSFKVIARSAHPQERCFKGGTFDSLETYADVSGIRYARNKMIKLAETTKRLTIAAPAEIRACPGTGHERNGGGGYAVCRRHQRDGQADFRALGVWLLPGQGAPYPERTLHHPNPP
jgi:hypothetical protein